MSLSKLRRKFSGLNIDGIFITELVNIQYLTGFTGSNGFALITDKKAYFITDSRYTIQAGEEVKDFEILIYSRAKGKGLYDIISRLIKKETIVNLGVEAETMTLTSVKRLKAVASDCEIIETHNIVLDLRSVKTKNEIAVIRKAIRIAESALYKTLPSIREGMQERDVAVELEYLMRREGADGLAFPTIAAFGKNAAKPHAAPGSARLKQGDVVLIDFGAHFQGYNSDLTRTFFFGKITPTRRKAYNAVQEASNRALRRLKAGIPGSAVDAAARNYLKSVKMDRNFTHGLGHGVGREVHELPNLSPKYAHLLPADSIVTVEPGVYNALWGGIRIEDMALVLPKTCKVLSSFTRELIVL